MQLDKLHELERKIGLELDIPMFSSLAPNIKDFLHKYGSDITYYQISFILYKSCPLMNIIPEMSLKNKQPNISNKIFSEKEIQNIENEKKFRSSKNKAIYTLNLKTYKPTKNSHIKTFLSDELIKSIIDYLE
jgi:hypothetical protein